MILLNIGSLNIDNVYSVDCFVQPGETKSAKNFSVNCGGKGLNQSIAAAKAGNDVWHASLVGSDGDFLVDSLIDNGVNVSLIKKTESKCGHAIIQVNSEGQNCILLYSGTNRMLAESDVDSFFESFPSRNAVLLQNEVNLLPYIIKKAKEYGHLVFLNAAPMDGNIFKCDLNLVDFLMVNEVEGRQVSGCEKEEHIIPTLRDRYPDTNVLLTLGENGAMCFCDGELWKIASRKVDVEDTTAAGDTFCGYFIFEMLESGNIERALEISTLASSICVGRKGAADSIPTRREILEIMNNKSIVRPMATKIAI